MNKSLLLVALSMMIVAGATLPAFAQTTPVSLTPDIVGHSNRYWENGYLAVREAEAPVVHLFDRSGRKLWKRTVAIPDAVTSGLLPVAIWPDGTVAVAGGARSSDGALAGFVAWIDASGKITKVLRTTPFIAWYMTVTPDGNLWALGRVFNPPGAQEDSPHQMVRTFSRDGVQLRETISRGAFAKWPPPTARASIASSGDRVGLYLAGTADWIELSTETGEVIARTKVQQPASAQVRRAVYGLHGELYVSGSVTVSNGAQNRSVPVFAKVGPKTGRWIDLTATLAASNLAPSTLVGADGGDLVFSSGDDRIRRQPMP